MRIVAITGIFPPDIGGPASYVPAVAEALAARGHAVTVITLSDAAGVDDSRRGYRVVRIRRRSPRLLRQVQTVCAILRAGRDADALFVHGLALEAALANSMLRRPLVQKVVGDLAWERLRTAGRVRESIEAFQQLRYGLRIELLKKLRAWWTGCSTTVIVPSAFLGSIVRGWGVAAEKIRIVHNALSATEACDGDIPPCFSVRRETKLIVSAGRMVPWKGFEQLIAAAADVPGAELAIIGEGPLRRSLEEYAGRSGMAGRVHFTGALSRSAVFAMLGRADLFVLNSSYEGLPHIVLEAMAAGAPVIAADAGGAGELVCDGHNGLLAPAGDTPALARMMRRVLEDGELACRLISGGRETVTEFGWDKLVTHTEQLLRDACGEAVQPERPPVLFISSTRIGSPPDATLVKKWRGLEPFFEATVLAFREAGGPRHLRLHGSRWHLLSSRPPRCVRYATHFLAACVLVWAGILRGRCRAVIAQSPYEALAPALALLPLRLLRSRPKLIVEVHSDWREGVMLYHRSVFSGLESLIRRALGTFSLSQADAYRAISDYCRQLLPRNGKPVFLFPTFTDPESFEPPPAERVHAVRQQYGSGFFLFAGMLIHLKGLHHLLNALQSVAQSFPGIRLVLAGRGADEQSLRAQAERLGLAEQVHFAGHLDQATLAACISNCLAFVLPSLTEGLGRVAIEAHLLGRPVVASRTGGIPEIVRDGETGILVDPGDEPGLAAALEVLLRDPDKAAAMGRRGRETVRHFFDYQAYFESYREMVAAVCERK